MAAPSGSGFWRGFLVGLGLAVLVALGLAWAFPPLRAPDLDESALAAPGGPLEPAATARPGRATPEARLPERPALPAAPAPDPDRTPAR